MVFGFLWRLLTARGVPLLAAVGILFCVAAVRVPGAKAQRPLDGASGLDDPRHSQRSIAASVQAPRSSAVRAVGTQRRELRRTNVVVRGRGVGPGLSSRLGGVPVEASAPAVPRQEAEVAEAPEFDLAALDAAIVRRSDQIEGCFSQMQHREPRYGGRLEMEIEIGTDGIRAVRVVDSTLPFGEGCFLRIVGSVRLPRWPEETLVVRRDLRFEPPPSRYDLAPVVMAIRGRLQRIQECYEGLLREDRGLIGAAKVQFSVFPTGRLGDFDVVESTAEPLGRCVIEGLESIIVAPAPVGESVRVEYPFVFAPRDP